MRPLVPSLLLQPRWHIRRTVTHLLTGLYVQSNFVAVNNGQHYTQNHALLIPSFHYRVGQKSGATDS